jgi:hypothetical protein
MVCAGSATAQQTPASMDIYGFAMLDMGHDFTSINPKSFDALRITRLPSFE